MPWSNRFLCIHTHAPSCTSRTLKQALSLSLSFCLSLSLSLSSSSPIALSWFPWLVPVSHYPARVSCFFLRPRLSASLSSRSSTATTSIHSFTTQLISARLIIVTIYRSWFLSHGWLAGECPFHEETVGFCPFPPSFFFHAFLFSFLCVCVFFHSLLPPRKKHPQKKVIHRQKPIAIFPFLVRYRQLI